MSFGRDSSDCAKEYLNLIAAEDNNLYVSTAAICKIEIYRRNGKVKCPIGKMERIKADGFILLPHTAVPLERPDGRAASPWPPPYRRREGRAPSRL